MRDICTTCGHWRGLHRWDTMQCPANGHDDGQFRQTTYTEENADLAALRRERDELLDELKWAWDNLAKSEPYPDEECEYDRCTVCRCPDWKHSETCQLKEREAAARAVLAKYAGKEE